MTKVQYSLKLDASGLSDLKKAAILKGLEKLESDGMDAVNEVVGDMQMFLNDYEHEVMSLRAPDPVLGWLNTAQWVVSFDFYMRRKNSLYGKFNIYNAQQPTQYYYEGISFNRFGEPKVWYASGTVINLAKVKYSTIGKPVFPRRAKVIMFYSHRANRLVYRPVRAYNIGGHDRYKHKIDGIISDCLDILPSYLTKYIAGSK